MSEKKSRKPHYKARSVLYRGLGFSLIGLTTVGGFFTYQAITNWTELKAQFAAETFTIVEPESVKLNPVFAIPLLTGFVIFLFIMMKKNKEFFKGKISFGLLITTAIIYLIYSIAIVTMAALIGAFAGSTIHEFVFEPMAVHAKKLDSENHEYDMEYEKEKRRLTARKQAAREELDGSV